MAEKQEETVEKTERVKTRQLVGLFPLDLRSELKQRVGGGKVGFSLKKSVTNVDVFNKDKQSSSPISIKQRESKPSTLIKSNQSCEIRKEATEEESAEESGQEKLSFKEKLQMIERSSSRSLVNPL